jgi:hypothetical protein
MKKVLPTQSIPIKDLARKSKLALMNYAKSEQACIGQTIIDLIASRLDPNVCI